MSDTFPTLEEFAELYGLAMDDPELHKLYDYYDINERERKMHERFEREREAEREAAFQERMAKREAEFQERMEKREAEFQERMEKALTEATAEMVEKLRKAGIDEALIAEILAE